MTTQRQKAINNAHKTANAIPQTNKGKDIRYTGSIQSKEDDPVKAVRLYMVTIGLGLKKSVEIECILTKYKSDHGKLKAQVNRVLNMKFFADAVEGQEDKVAKVEYTQSVKGSQVKDSKGSQDKEISNQIVL